MASELSQEDFDAYHVWLQIPSDRRPPTYYDLLGLKPLTDDIESVRHAFRARYKFVRQFQTGRRAELAHRVLNELSVAVACLTDEQRKQAYDAQHFAASVGDGQTPPTTIDRSTPESDEPLESKMLRDLLRQLDEPDDGDGSSASSAINPPAPPPRHGNRPTGPPPLRDTSPWQPVVPPLPSSRVQAEQHYRTAKVFRAYERSLLALLAPWIALVISTCLAATVGVMAGKWLSQTDGDFDRWATAEAVDMVVSLTFWPGIVVSIILLAWMSYDAGIDSVDYCRGTGERLRFAAIHVSDRMAEFNRMFFAVLCFLGMSSFGIFLSLNFTL